MKYAAIKACNYHTYSVNGGKYERHPDLEEVFAKVAAVLQLDIDVVRNFVTNNSGSSLNHPEFASLLELERFLIFVNETFEKNVPREVKTLWITNYETDSAFVWTHSFF